MLGSAVFYGGVGVILIGLVLMIRPVQRLGISTRPRAMLVCGIGLLGAAGALQLPTIETRTISPSTRLDELTPVWQFREFHSRRLSAPPEEVYAALRRVRADDILLFHTLTWIRRGGRELPPSMLNAGTDRPLLDIALTSGFVLLADDPPREIVIGAIVDAPTGANRARGAEIVRHPPPGYSAATMNFRLVPDGTGTRVSTETRVFSNGRETTRRFARYWRVIYPGSAIIRRMWLRAIEQRTANSEQRISGGVPLLTCAPSSARPSLPSALASPSYARLPCSHPFLPCAWQEQRCGGRPSRCGEQPS